MSNLYLYLAARKTNKTSLQKRSKAKAINFSVNKSFCSLAV